MLRLVVVCALVCAGSCAQAEHGIAVRLNRVIPLNTTTAAADESDDIYPAYDDDDDDDDDYYYDDDDYDDYDEDEAVTDGTGCPVAFKARCVCGLARFGADNGFVVNCTDTGFTSTAPLAYLPEVTEALVFTGNYVRRLGRNVFGRRVHFDDLVSIDLSNNKITVIDGRAFHRVSRVTTLVLNHNNISLVRERPHVRVFSGFANLRSLHLTNAFADTADSRWYLISLERVFNGSRLHRLTKLHLEQNELWQLQNRQLFCQLPALEQLYLGSNRLAAVDFNLTCLANISYIDLEYNSIYRLSANDTSQLDRLAGRNPHFSLRLTGNPFHCDCQFRHFLDWLLSTPVRLRQLAEYRCFEADAPRLLGAPLLHIRRWLVPCLLADRHSSRSLTAAGRASDSSRSSSSSDSGGGSSISDVVLPSVLAFLAVFVTALAVTALCVYRSTLARRARLLSVRCSDALHKTLQSRQYVVLGGATYPTAV